MYVEYFYNDDGKPEMIDDGDGWTYPDEEPVEYPSRFPSDYDWWDHQVEDSDDSSDDESFDDDDFMPF